jgi:hypothetical protein
MVSVDSLCWRSVRTSERPICSGPASCEVRIRNQLVFLDSNLIYRTERGDEVRSNRSGPLQISSMRLPLTITMDSQILDGIEPYPRSNIVDDTAGTYGIENKMAGSGTMNAGSDGNANWQLFAGKEFCLRRRVAGPTAHC